MDTLKLNETISFYRKKQELTQEQLANALGVTNQSVSKWESGQCCPDISLLPQLAELFGISIDELFGKEPPKTADCGVLPPDIDWEDDDVIRVVVARGQHVLQAEEWGEPIEIRFSNVRDTNGCYNLIVNGNFHCESDVYGDIMCTGNVSCEGDLNGDVYGGCIECHGDFNGEVYD